MAACTKCGISDDEAWLEKCPICHQMFCDDHKFVRSGRSFCSEHCAAGFFHGDDDDDTDEES